MLLTAAAVVVGSSVILFDPIFQGLAVSMMAGEVAATLLSRATELNDKHAAIARRIVNASGRTIRMVSDLLDLTRTNHKITAESIADFIENLDLEENVKAELKAITPFNYTGF
jgi:K+-sensing histidine kinase KdpD